MKKREKATKQRLGAVYAEPNMLLFSITFEANMAIACLTNLLKQLNKYVEIINEKEK